MIGEGPLFTEDRMEYANDEERLIAEQAVRNFRELMAVIKTVRHGRGMCAL